MGKARGIDEERADCENCDDKECVFCGSKLRRHLSRCPRCGNVFSKEGEGNGTSDD